MQRRHHSEQAFEHYLRANRIPYIGVHEARKTLLPEDAGLRAASAELGMVSLKSFDFVVYADPEDGGPNLLIDVKGRKLPARAAAAGVARLENWVTEDDVASLAAWESLFGDGFRAAFAFLYRCEQQPPDGVFPEVLSHRGCWYAMAAALLDDYAARMRPRSARWRTVHMPGDEFGRIARPLLGAGTG